MNKTFQRHGSLLLTLLATVLMVLPSCDETSVPELPQLVVEGFIDSEGYPQVTLTTTFVDGDGESLSDKVVKWGKVTVSDGEQTVVMTGEPDKRLLPPYRYYTHEMTGVPGRRYTVEAIWHGMTARAECVMPPLPEIVDVEMTPIAESDTLREVTVKIRAPQDVPAYYHISTRVLPEETSWLPAALGCVKAECGEEVLTVPVHRGKSMMGIEHFSPLIPSNRMVLVRVERVTAEIYDFWQRYNDTVLFGSSLFVGHPESIGGNIEGGYGYFSAQGVKTILLPPKK